MHFAWWPGISERFLRWGLSEAIKLRQMRRRHRSCGPLNYAVHQSGIEWERGFVTWRPEQHGASLPFAGDVGSNTPPDDYGHTRALSVPELRQGLGRGTLYYSYNRPGSILRSHPSSDFGNLLENRNRDSWNRESNPRTLECDDVIKLGARLHSANLSMTEKLPIILDGSHHFTQLLMMQTHIRLHHLGINIVLTELRNEFWVLRARQTIKKSYIVLFTRATTCAIHYKLVTDMLTDRLLMAIQRFAGCHNLPHTIYSDNATTFHAANKELDKMFKYIEDCKIQHYREHHGVTWKFIASWVAWWGGWWEKMIGSTKRCLRKVLLRSQRDEEGLNTILISIEATLNSWSLTQDADSNQVLTPAHFLNGEKLTIIPNGPEPSTERSSEKVTSQTKSSRGLLATLKKRVPFVNDELSLSERTTETTQTQSRGNCSLSRRLDPDICGREHG
ncbi:hypothetical protein PR048_020265 [Dryococelus australis]|uniref:Integrase catalytic domain-containing protein n=1 Tax=Dryococelus australis TaxID=614101 RepID=A0ABQ9H5X8_9NEOP|nr:hypothetical protein PR048_020265 [Dryococelus australis]